MARTVTLKDEKIIESWAMIIDSGTGKADAIFSTIEKLLEESDAPDVQWERVDAQPGMLKGLLLSKKRDYLRIVSKGVGDEYRMYVGARDFGKHQADGGSPYGDRPPPLRRDVVSDGRAELVQAHR